VAPHKVPALPPEARRRGTGGCVWRVLKGMVPSVVLIFLVLGTIFIGLATPTEAGAMGVVGAVALPPRSTAASPGPWCGRPWATTMRITAMVIFILIGATVFSLVFQGVDGASGSSTC
jgi:TRAP-type mannitol/chloroaromatic compound transport system permease large subunit